jgi:hypothetical protein
LPSGGQVGLQIVADVNARVNQPAAGMPGEHNLAIEVRQARKELVFSPIEAGTQRRDEVAEVVFDTARGGHHVGGADEFFPAEVNKIVLVVIGKSQHLVRHDVPDVDHQVPRLFHQHPVEYDRQRPIGQPVGLLIDHPRRHLAHRDASAAPIVGMGPLVRDRAEHLPIFRSRMGHMLAQRGNDMNLGLILEQFVEHFGEPPNARVHPRNIRRQQQHPPRRRADSPSRYGNRLAHQRFKALPTNLSGTFTNRGHQ